MEKDSAIAELPLRVRIIEQQIRKLDDNIKSLENMLNFLNKNFDEKIKNLKLEVDLSLIHI